MELVIGEDTVAAEYVSAIADNELLFAYSVGAGIEGDGFTVPANPFRLGADATIRDLPGNDAVLEDEGLAAEGMIIDGVVPRVTEVAVTSSPSKGAYRQDESVEITVTFDEPVTVSGTPRIAVTIGDVVAMADYASYDGGAVSFAYAVQLGDLDTDGVGITADAIDTSAGAIVDVAGNDADTQHAALADQSGHSVDGVPPTITDLALVGEPETIGMGEAVELAVTFSEAVEVNRIPTIELLIGSDTVAAHFVRVTENNRATFVYIVREGILGDGFTVPANPFRLEGESSIRDLPGNDADLAHAGLTVEGIVIDGTGPSVDAIAITTSPTGGAYSQGEDIEVTVTFDEPVTITGTPRIALTIGESTAMAAYASSDGPMGVFAYTVEVGDLDTDGVSIAADALDVAGGAIVDVAGNDADTQHAALADQPDHPVDGIAPTIADLALAGDGSAIGVGGSVDFMATFSEPVEVTGMPAIELVIGDDTVEAQFVSAAAEDQLVFSYAVGAEIKGDSITVPADPFHLHTGAAVHDLPGNAADLTHPGLTVSIIVDGAAPTVSEVAITSTPDGEAYGQGEAIELAVTFDESVDVSGAPQLALTIGEAIGIAEYANSDGAMVTFSYTVQVGDLDTDGISISDNALDTSNGEIADAAGNATDAMHGALSDQAGHEVDGIAPTIASVMLTSTPATQSTYTLGESIEVTVTFSERVSVSGSADLALVIGDADRAAALASSDGDTLVFAYAVTRDDLDEDGVAIGVNAISDPDTSIRDGSGNPANLNHDALDDDPGHMVNGLPAGAIAQLPDMALTAGGDARTVDASVAFEGFLLNYTASSSSTSVATVTLDGSQVTVAPGVEGRATVTVTATNVGGTDSVTFAVTVSTDPMENAVIEDTLAAIGRGTLASITSTIASRFEFDGLDPHHVAVLNRAASLATGRGGMFAMELSGEKRKEDMAAKGVTIWGAADIQYFDGDPSGRSYDGEVRSGYLGVDVRQGSLLTGVALSRSVGEADYSFTGRRASGDGSLETELTSALPYLQWKPNDDREYWVIAGGGSGDISHDRRTTGTYESSDLGMWMAAAGMRDHLLPRGNMELAIVGDAGALVLGTDDGAAQRIDDLSVSVGRIRVGLEGSRTFLLEDGALFTPFADVTGRHDTGAGHMVGSGLEFAAGLRYLNPANRLGIEARARYMGLHAGGDYSESGFSIAAKMQPGTGGRGLSFALAPGLGATGIDRPGASAAAFGSGFGLDLTSAEAAAARFGRLATGWRLDAEVGYGFAAPRLRGVLTPFAESRRLGADRQRARLGVRYRSELMTLTDMEVEFSAERERSERFGDEDAVLLRALLPF